MEEGRYKLAFGSMRRGETECGQKLLRLSKISDLLPANWELDFLMGGKEEGRGEKGRCEERLLTWQPDKRMLWLAPEAEAGRVL